MTWDYFSQLTLRNRDSPELPYELASCFIDEKAKEFLEGNRERARRDYMSSVKERSFQIPQEVKDLYPNFSRLVSQCWLGFAVGFELLTPWYSKDDRVFHVLDNPVRKDRVFGVPFMSAASWKGMLRWACRMQAGLREHLENGKHIEDWNDPDWILQLFGNEKGEEKSFHQGALVFYPTWFDKIGFEVINPHSRERRAGTQPIYYEVVPGRRPKRNNPSEFEEGGKGTLHLLYAPWPGMKPQVPIQKIVPPLLEAIETLLTTYGISAKRTVGWGTAKITGWKAFQRDRSPLEKKSREELWQEIEGWFR